ETHGEEHDGGGARHGTSTSRVRRPSRDRQWRFGADSRSNEDGRPSAAITVGGGRRGQPSRRPKTAGGQPDGMLQLFTVPPEANGPIASLAIQRRASAHTAAACAGKDQERRGSGLLHGGCRARRAA